jgi:hypothetical protein
MIIPSYVEYVRQCSFEFPLLRALVRTTYGCGLCRGCQRQTRNRVQVLDLLSGGVRGQLRNASLAFALVGEEHTLHLR